MLVHAFLENGVWLHSPIAANVANLHAATGHDPAHEKAAMAAMGILFTTHDGHTVLSETFFQARYSRLKERGLSDAIIQGETFGVIIFFAFGSAA